jgi:hypothetical protein
MIPLLAVVFLALPAAIPASTTKTLSSSAEATVSLNSSRSNVYRQDKPKSNTPANKRLAPPPAKPILPQK